MVETTPEVTIKASDARMNPLTPVNVIKIKNSTIKIF